MPCLENTCNLYAIIFGFLVSALSICCHLVESCPPALSSTQLTEHGGLSGRSMFSSRQCGGSCWTTFGWKTVAIIVTDVNVGRLLRVRTIASSGSRDNDNFSTPSSKLTDSRSSLFFETNKSFLQHRHARLDILRLHHWPPTKQ